MDGTSQDIELLLVSARHEIARLRDDPRMIAESTGSRGAGLRDHVLDLIGAVEHRIDAKPLDSQPQAAYQAFARRLRQGIMMLQGAHAALPWLAATRNPNINLGSLYLTEELARVLVGEDVDLVVVPSPEFMYSTTSRPFTAVIDGTRGFEPRAKRRPIVLNYPLTDSDRLLLHSVFAHELGHASVDEYELVEEVQAYLDVEPKFTTALGLAVEEMKEEWTFAKSSQIASTLRAWLRGWLEELLCDYLALETMGPAFLWSFVAFAMPLSYGEFGQVHPPNTVRVRLALSHLTSRGWRPFMDHVAPGVTEWLDYIAADSTAALPTQYSFLRDQILANTEVLQKVAIDRIGDDSLKPEMAEEEADEAADLLKRLILPVGLSTPLESRSILLGGWQAAAQKHGDRPEGIVNALADRELQELVGKAIEMSTVARSWRTLV